MAIVKGTSLTKEEMEQAGGGGIFMYPEDPNNWETMVYEVIDDRTGNVMAKFGNNYYYEAECFAKAHGMTTDFMAWEDVNNLRKGNQK